MSLYTTSEQAIADWMVDVCSLIEYRLRTSWILGSGANRAFRRLATTPDVFLYSQPPAGPMDGVWRSRRSMTLSGAGFVPDVGYAFRTLSATSGVDGRDPRLAMRPAGPSRRRTLSVDDFPHIHELDAPLREVDHDAEFEFGLDLILAGLKERLR